MENQNNAVVAGFVAGVHGTSEARGELFKALAAAQSQAGNATKDAVNPHLRNSYSSLASVLDAIRPVLAANNLSYTQVVDGDNLVNVLGHASGAMLVNFVPLINAKKDMQALGSSITYARRYSVSAAFQVAQEDDDGNVAAGKLSSPGGAPAVRPTNGAPAPTQPAAPIAKSAFGKISDASAQAVVEARSKVAAVMSAKELDNISSFAQAKYTGPALEAVNGYIADRRKEIAEQAAA